VLLKIVYVLTCRILALAVVLFRSDTALPHQGIAQHVPDGDRDTTRITVTDLDTAQIRRKPVLGGLINEYTHAASRRPHRSRQLHSPRPDHPADDLSQERIRRRLVLGGLINEYERPA
jgi:hypothetical protein